MVVEAVLATASTFKKLLEAIKDLLTEATWDCTDNGLALQAMDSSHVALVSVKLEAQGFEEFRCDRSQSIGINIQNMAKLIKCAGNDDSMKLVMQEDADTIHFVFTSPNQERECEYEMKLMDLDVEHLGIPETDYSCTIRMPSAEFARICRDMALIGDALTISVTKGSASFTAKGDLGSGAVRLTPTANADKPEDAVEIELNDPVCATFALKYLAFFAKATPLAQQVSISLSSDVPIVVEYKVEEMGYIRYYLAPKIDETNEGGADAMN